jgi:hypothetical protein
MQTQVSGETTVLAFDTLTVMAYPLTRATGCLAHFWVSLWRPELVQLSKYAAGEVLVS